ncbi:hypothetical protein [Methanosarcina vacuolata]|nr:hypothetical protein [Methanosarcina vacuolata]
MKLELKIQAKGFFDSKLFETLFLDNKLEVILPCALALNIRFA